MADLSKDNLEIEIEDQDPVPAHTPQDREPGFEKPGVEGTEAGEQRQPGKLTPEQLEINREGVAQTARLLGNILEALTRIPELNFNQVEITVMANAWAPFFPAGSPLSAALIATMIIAGGKVGVYFKYRNHRDEPPTAAGVPVD